MMAFEKKRISVNQGLTLHTDSVGLSKYHKAVKNFKKV